MRIIRFLTAAFLLLILVLPSGCGTGDTGSIEELPPEDQAEIDAIRESYGSTGRYGPGGQSTPESTAEPAAEGESAPE